MKWIIKIYKNIRNIKHYKQKTMETKILLTSEFSVCPTKGTPQAAGYDLYSIEEGEIYPQERKMIDTGIQMQIPNGYYGRIAPRSGLALKNGMDVMAGVIDSDYRNNIKCILLNTDKNNIYKYNIGDKIAQIIIEKHYDICFVDSDILDKTARSGGFGSTGK